MNSQNIRKQRNRQSIMGLKTFHMIFIAVCILLAVYFSYWSFNYSSQTSSKVYLGMSLVSLIMTITLIIYGIQTQKKYNS